MTTTPDPDWLHVRIRARPVHAFRKRTRRKWLRVSRLPTVAATTTTCRLHCGAKLVWQVHPDDVAAIFREWGITPAGGDAYYVDSHQVVPPRRRGNRAG